MLLPCTFLVCLHAQRRHHMYCSTCCLLRLQQVDASQVTMQHTLLPCTF